MCRVYRIQTRIQIKSTQISDEQIEWVFLGIEFECECEWYVICQFNIDINVIIWPNLLLAQIIESGLCVLCVCVCLFCSFFSYRHRLTKMCEVQMIFSAILIRS